MRQNEDYFEEIDTKRKAYWLGLLYADGYNSSNTQYKNSKKGKSVELDLQDSDKHILEEFLKDVPFGSIRKYNNYSYRLVFNSKKMSDDLTKLGCVANKTYVIKFPNSDILEDQYIPHFIRGYFDGDGCVWEGKRKRMKVSDPNNEKGYRTRIIHNVKFTITGNLALISSIQKKLITELNFRKTKLNTGKSKEFVTVEYSGRKQMKTFYNYIYNNSSLFLNRKKEKFNSILNCANS